MAKRNKNIVLASGEAEYYVKELLYGLGISSFDPMDLPVDEYVRECVETGHDPTITNPFDFIRGDED